MYGVSELGDLAGHPGRGQARDQRRNRPDRVHPTAQMVQDFLPPAKLVLYREVDRDMLANAGVDVSKFAGDRIPTVFHANMRDPTIFFAAQKFRMQDKDVIYVSNAETVELAKFLSLVNGVSDTTANVPANAITTRKSVRQMTN